MNALETLKQNVLTLSVLERKLLAGHLAAVDRPKEERAAPPRRTAAVETRRWYTIEEAEALLAKIPPPPDE